MPPKDKSNWPPKAPPVRDDFKNSRENIQRFRAKVQESKAVKPVSKKERENLNNQRAKPRSGVTMNPPGMSRVPRDSSQEKARESRINHIDKRLGMNQGKAREAFKRSKGR